MGLARRRDSVIFILLILELVPVEESPCLPERLPTLLKHRGVRKDMAKGVQPQGQAMRVGTASSFDTRTFPSMEQATTSIKAFEAPRDLWDPGK